MQDGEKSADTKDGAAAAAPTASNLDDSIKWGAEVLAVLPDAWLEAEFKRRQQRGQASTSVATGESSEMMATTATAAVDEAAATAGGSCKWISSGSDGRVKLCNTGKCEMFD